MKQRTLICMVAAPVLYLLVPLLFGSNLYMMSLVVASLTIGGIALAWALLGNLGGMVSFGQAAFFGVGSYASALLTLKFGLPVFPAMLLGGVGAAIASLAMLPALRLKGPYFALAILAYAQIFRILATQFQDITGGSGGLSNIPQLPNVLGFDLGSKVGGYLVILTMVVAFVWAYHLIRKSYYGLALRAMHESEDATRVVGVNSTLLKASMLVVSAFMTGMIGAFNAHYINFLEPDYAFGSSWTVIPIIAAIFGGYRTLLGPLVGAVAVYMIDQLIFKNLIPTGHQMILGVLLVMMIIFSPAGLVPLLAQKFKRKTHVKA
ncbi:Branched-chain amino acid transport system permease protein LivM [Collimonas arenae]|uniref:Branched-chain amino acid transport system permease protein LivM n=1 Tax=Collimonas arenae TaxID=279058 RepID=A0A0A1FEB2_9BURK|nr:branched-chain amino acid ABC transporter permease [Collimonas arenae]AIY43103.1 Branched-chain amino acid transport system permease protein LivM [Collimonas arenae]